MIRRLWANMNLVNRSPVVPVLGLPQKCRPLAVTQFESVFLFCIGLRKFVLPGSLRREIELFLECFPVAYQKAHLCTWDRLIHIQ